MDRPASVAPLVPLVLLVAEADAEAEAEADGPDHAEASTMAAMTAPNPVAHGYVRRVLMEPF